MPVMKNVVIRNSRIVTPVRKSWGGQYSLVIETPQGHIISDSSADGENQYWLNWNAEYPNGDSIAPVPQVRGKSVVTDPTELGNGSVVDLAFETVERNGKNYYNLKAIKLVQYVKPKSLLDLFDTDETFESDPVEAFDEEPQF